ncbi:hypothetical protein J6590_077814 [Homalodisca vitripennis]|nr:hypothetical protein J6590_077814 [Homalodisca vitripennis]
MAPRHGNFTAPLYVLQHEEEHYPWSAKKANSSRGARAIIGRRKDAVPPLHNQSGGEGVRHVRGVSEWEAGRVGHPGGAGRCRHSCKTAVSGIGSRPATGHNPGGRTCTTGPTS